MHRQGQVQAISHAKRGLTLLDGLKVGCRLSCPKPCPIERSPLRRLFIAEKPSVATELAQLLGVTRREREFFICGDDIVSSCFGHLYEMPKPHYYDKAFSEWAFDNLPIVPPAWVVLPKDEARDRIKLLTTFMREVDVVVNAGDPDNEGQLLVDEVVEKAKFRGQVLRFWASAQDPASLRDAMENLRDNRDFAGMRDAARGRGRADWLIGMNASRAFTLRAQAKGNRGVVPVGRVMTPTLAMVAAADEKFANFKPVPYHFVTVLVRHAEGEFRMRWQPLEDQVGLDEEGRLVDAAVADELVARIAGQPRRPSPKTFWTGERRSSRRAIACRRTRTTARKSPSGSSRPEAPGSRRGLRAAHAGRGLGEAPRADGRLPRAGCQACGRRAAIPAGRQGPGSAFAGRTRRHPTPFERGTNRTAPADCARTARSRSGPLSQVATEESPASRWLFLCVSLAACTGLVWNIEAGWCLGRAVS